MNDQNFANLNKTLSKLLSQNNRAGVVPPLRPSAPTRKKIAPLVPASQPKPQPLEPNDCKKPAAHKTPRQHKPHERHKFTFNGVESVFASSSFEKTRHSAGGGHGPSPGGVAGIKSEPSLSHGSKPKIIKSEVKDEKQLYKDFMDSEMMIVDDGVHNQLFPHTVAGDVYNPDEPSKTSREPHNLQKVFLENLQSEGVLLRVPSRLLKLSGREEGVLWGGASRGKLRVHRSGKVEVSLGALSAHLESGPLPTSLRIPAVIRGPHLTLLAPPATCLQLLPRVEPLLASADWRQ